MAMETDRVTSDMAANGKYITSCTPTVSTTYEKSTAKWDTKISEIQFNSNFWIYIIQKSNRFNSSDINLMNGVVA